MCTVVLTYLSCVLTFIPLSVHRNIHPMQELLGGPGREGSTVWSLFTLLLGTDGVNRCMRSFMSVARTLRRIQREGFREKGMMGQGSG